MDFSEIANNPFAQMFAGIITLAGGYRYWRNQQSGDAKERADNQGQIAALDAWQKLLADSNAARVRAEERADRFAQERNEAMAQVFEMKGQLKVLTETLAAQTEELHALRDQVNALKDQLK